MYRKMCAALRMLKQQQEAAGGQGSADAEDVSVLTRTWAAAVQLFITYSGEHFIDYRFIHPFDA